MVDKPYAERYALLEKLLKMKGVPKNVMLVPKFTAKDEAEVMKYHKH
jgi:hypothetical protein